MSKKVEHKSKPESKVITKDKIVNWLREKLNEGETGKMLKVKEFAISDAIVKIGVAVVESRSGRPFPCMIIRIVRGKGNVNDFIIPARVVEYVAGAIKTVSDIDLNEIIGALKEFSEPTRVRVKEEEEPETESEEKSEKE